MQGWGGGPGGDDLEGWTSGVRARGSVIGPNRSNESLWIFAVTWERGFGRLNTLSMRVRARSRASGYRRGCGAAPSWRADRFSPSHTPMWRGIHHAGQQLGAGHPAPSGRVVGSEARRGEGKGDRRAAAHRANIPGRGG